MRPFIHVNCAMSADGKIAGIERKQVLISSDEDKARVRGLREKYDAILVGVGTVLSDNPHLTVKGKDYDTNPIRIVIDPHGKTPDNALVLDNDAPTIMITTRDCAKEWDCEETMVMDERINLRKLTERLAEEIGIGSILVEGGGNTISEFFRNKLVDRYSVFIGGLLIGGRDAPTPADGNGWVCEGGLKMNLDNIEILGNGAVLTFTPLY